MIYMTRITAALVLVLITMVGLAAPAFAGTSVSVGVASQYLFRGVPSGSPQVMGSLDYTAVSGLYGSLWASSSNHGSDFADSEDDEQELDVFGGYTFMLGPLHFDMGYIAYLFPGSPSGEQHGNNSELYFGTGTEHFSAYAYYNFGSDRNRFQDAPDRRFDDDQFVYLEGNFNYPLTDSGRVTFGAHVGYTEPTGSDVSDISGYFDYSLSLRFNGWHLTAAATNADEFILGGPNTGRSAAGHRFSGPRFTIGYTWRWNDIFDL